MRQMNGGLFNHSVHLSSIAQATANITHLGRSRAPASATIVALKGSPNKVGKGSYATSVHIDGRCGGSEYPCRVHGEQRGFQVGSDQALWRHGRQPVLDRKLVRLWHQQERSRARGALEVPAKRTAFQRICRRLHTCGLGVQRLHGGSLREDQRETLQEAGVGLGLGGDESGRKIPSPQVLPRSGPGEVLGPRGAPYAPHQSTQDEGRTVVIARRN